MSTGWIKRLQIQKPVMNWKVTKARRADKRRDLVHFLLMRIGHKIRGPRTWPRAATRAPTHSEDPVHGYVTSFNSRHLAIAIAVCHSIAAHTGRCLHALAACPNLSAAVKQLYTQPLSPLGAKLDTYPLRTHMRRVSPLDFFLLSSLRWGPSWGHKKM